MEEVKTTPAEIVPTTSKAPKEKLTPAFDNLEVSIKLWWKNIRSIVDIYAWGIAYAVIPMIIIAVLVWLQNSSFVTSISGVPLRMFLLVLGFAAVAFSVYFLVRAYMGIFLLVKSNYVGKGKEIFAETKKYFWDYLWLTILSTILILLWSLLLIIPGIIFSVFYGLAAYVFFFEGKKGMEAIKRSRALVKSYFWPVLGRTLLVGLLMWIVMMLISAPASFAIKNSPFAIFWNIIVQIISFLIGPIVLIFSYNIYSDLFRIKK
jgi:hypothetical protein